jgi:hypothetical protein
MYSDYGSESQRKIRIWMMRHFSSVSGDVRPTGFVTRNISFS